MTNKDEQLYLNAIKTTESEIENYINRSKKEATATEYAIAHLKQNLNWYKMKYSKTDSCNRNKEIVDDVYKLFNYSIDKNKISTFLSKKGFLSTSEIIVLAVTTYICGLLVVFTMIDAQDKIELLNIRLGYIIFYGIFNILFCVTYCSSSLIKFYFTGKIKNG